MSFKLLVAPDVSERRRIRFLNSQPLIYSTRLCLVITRLQTCATWTYERPPNLLLRYIDQAGVAILELEPLPLLAHYSSLR